MLYHFWIRILSARVPVWAATSFFRSPMVSSSLHFTRTFFPSLSFSTTSIIFFFCKVSSPKAPDPYPEFLWIGCLWSCRGAKQLKYEEVGPLSNVLQCPTEGIFVFSP
ncbi:unnamed protein product [Prunus brigantina]